MKNNKSESQIQSDIALEFNKGATRLFKNVVGNFWTGKMVDFKDGLVRLANARRIKCGLVTGAADRIGFHQIEITSAMVGKTIAIFTAVELKTCVGSATPEQKQFLKVISDMGGIAGIAREKKDIEILFDSFVKQLQS